MTLLNSGTITTTTSGSSGAYGIDSNGNSGTTTVTNSGTITTSGSSGRGIWSYGNSGTETITNSGTITTSGSSSDGIKSYNNRDTSTLTNSGTITTSGSSSRGIWSYGNNGTETITNSGTITTSGSSAHGIFVSSNTGTTTITNSGTIKVTGSDAVGVKFDGGVTLNNSGTISANGSATKAIESTGSSNDTLTLSSGSNITGSIDLGAGTDTVNITGVNGCATSACMSTSLTFANTENINLSGVTGAVSNGVAATVDPTGNSVLGVSLSTMTSAVHDVVSQRMARTRTLGTPAAGRGVSSWGQTIGAYRSRGTEGSAMGHSHSYVGFTGGMEKKVKDGRFGVIAGYASSSVSTKKMSNSTNTNSFFGGIYGDVHLGRQVSLTTSLLGGYEYHDNTRNVRNNVVGVESAKSDFSSTFFSPSVTLSSAHPFEYANRSFELRPSITGVYTIAQYDNYQEKGTTGANLAVSSRTVQAVNVRAQLAVATQINKHSEFELRSGFVSRQTDHDKITASLGGNSFQFKGAGDNNVQGGFVGGSLRYHATDSLRAVVDVKYRGAGGRESEFIGRAGISYNF